MQRMLGILIVIVASLGGCATIGAGTKDKIVIKSNPSEARVTMDGYVVGHTPLILELSKKPKSYHFQFDKEGYHTEEHLLKTRKDLRWFAASAVIGSAYLGVPFIIDWQTGAYYKFMDNEIKYSLKKDEIYWNDAVRSLNITGKNSQIPQINKEKAQVSSTSDSTSHHEEQKKQYLKYAGFIFSGYVVATTVALIIAILKVLPSSDAEPWCCV